MDKRRIGNSCDSRTSLKSSLSIPVKTWPIGYSLE